MLAQVTSLQQQIVTEKQKVSLVEMQNAHLRKENKKLKEMAFADTHHIIYVPKFKRKSLVLVKDLIVVYLNRCFKAISRYARNIISVIWPAEDEDDGDATKKKE